MLDKNSESQEHNASAINKSLMPLWFAGLIGFLVLVIVAQFEKASLKQVHKEIFRESQVTALEFERAFNDANNSIASLVRFLASQPTTARFIKEIESDNLSEQARQDIESTFLTFLQTHNDFYQLRIISTLDKNSGQELARVEHKGLDFTISSIDELQNKAHRDYFEPSSKLSEDEIFISSLSLNKELGEIDTPYRPTLRFSISLYSGNKKVGFLIANINMSEFLIDLSRQRGPYGLYMLEDTNGLFSYHYDDSLQYGVDLNPKASLSQQYQSEAILGGMLFELRENFGKQQALINYQFNIHLSNPDSYSSRSDLKLHLLTKNELAIQRLNERRTTFYWSLFATILASMIVVFSFYRNVKKTTALKQAKDISKTKSDFISSVSHEMRTPLNGIAGALTLLKDKEQSQYNQKYISIADTSTTILSALINDILDLSKIELGKLELFPVEFDPNELIQTVMQSLCVTRHAKDIELTLDIQNLEFSTVLADKQRVTQVLNNLISNALKFTNKGSVHVTVSSQIESEQESFLRVSVKDSGEGISQENQQKLFKQFSQVSQRNELHMSGSGLGLMISRKLCELMGGNINLSSVEGEGTEVSFRINIKEWKIATPTAEPRVVSFNYNSDFSANDAHLQARPFVVNDGTSNITFKDKTILIVDDNEINIEIAKSMLSPLKCHLLKAYNGKQALEILQSLDKMDKHCDLILMDCAMPILDGYQAARALRSGQCGDKYATVPIIALTANAMKGEREKCIAAGMDDYITKPFARDLFIQLVTKYIVSSASQTETKNR